VGRTIGEIAQLTGLTPQTIESRISRARCKEGLAKWPRRHGSQRKPSPEPSRRAGKVTLPPLPSLTDWPDTAA